MPYQALQLLKIANLLKEPFFGMAFFIIFVIWQVKAKLQQNQEKSLSVRREQVWQRKASLSMMRSLKSIEGRVGNYLSSSLIFPSKYIITSSQTSENFSGSSIENS
jgi:hypothetical protein